MDAKQVDVMVADASHEVYVDKILDTIREAAKVRGTGIAERTHEYVTTKMKEGKAIIALCGEDFAGFTYIESWGNKQYVATSGLIVHPNYRGIGLAKRIKAASFRLARLRWPKAKIFSLTSGAAVMKMNTALGYVPVTFNELTDDVFTRYQVFCAENGLQAGSKLTFSKQINRVLGTVSKQSWVNGKNRKIFQLP